MNSARLGALAHEKHGWQAEAGTPAGAEGTDLDPDELSALSGTVGKLRPDPFFLQRRGQH